jgi:antitoxin YefM
MKTVNFTQARAHLADVLDSVIDDAEEVVVTRAGHGSVVIVSLADWNSIKETEYLLNNPAMAAHLRESIAQAERGEMVARNLVDPEAVQDVA